MASAYRQCDECGKKKYCSDQYARQPCGVSLRASACKSRQQSIDCAQVEKANRYGGSNAFHARICPLAIMPEDGRRYEAATQQSLAFGLPSKNLVVVLKSMSIQWSPERAPEFQCYDERPSILRSCRGIFATAGQNTLREDATPMHNENNGACRKQLRVHPKALCVGPLG